MNTVIFDLGGVLVDFHPYEGMKNMSFPMQQHFSMD